MAPVVVELGAQAGLVIPLIAVHLFVFYYGIMGDITPPVGLATFAAAAISGEDSIKTGIQGAIYALRTVILPFIWIFNPLLLLIDIDSVAELILVVRASTLAMLMFAAVTMNWFRVQEPLVGERAARDRRCAAVPAGLLHGFHRRGIHARCRRSRSTTSRATCRTAGGWSLGDQGAIDRRRRRSQDRCRAARAEGRRRAQAACGRAASRCRQLGDNLQIAGVKFGSRARKAGFEQGFDVDRVEVRSNRTARRTGSTCRRCCSSRSCGGPRAGAWPSGARFDAPPQTQPSV